MAKMIAAGKMSEKWQGGDKRRTQTDSYTHTQPTHTLEPDTLPSPLHSGGVYVCLSDWKCVSVLACSSALMSPEEVNERAPQLFIPITIVSPYSGR